MSVGNECLALQGGVCGGGWGSGGDSQVARYLGASLSTAPPENSGALNIDKSRGINIWGLLEIEGFLPRHHKLSESHETGKVF